MFRLTEAARKLALDAVTLSLARFLGTASRIFYFIFVARLLGPELYGLLVYSQAWYLLFLALAGLGLQDMIFKNVGQNSIASTPLVEQAFSFRIFSAVVTAILAGIIGIAIESNPQVQTAIFMFSVALAARSIYQLVVMLFIAYERPRWLLPISVVIPPMEPVLAIVILSLNGGIMALAGLHASLWILQAIAIAIIAAYKGLMPRLVLFNRNGWIMLGSAFPLLLGGILIGQILQGPVVFYRWFEGGDLGQLSILIQLVITLGVIPLSITQALLPAMSRRFARDQLSAEEFTKRIVDLSVFGALLAAIIAYPIAPVLVKLILGSDYLLAGQYIWFAVALLGIFSAGLFFNQLLIAQGRFWSVMTAAASGAAFLILGFTAIKPDNAILAIALGGSGYVVWALVGALLTRTERFFIPRLAIATAIGTILFTVEYKWMAVAITFFIWGLSVILLFRRKTERLVTKT